MSQLTNGWHFFLPQEMNIPAYYQMPWRTNAGIDPGRSIGFARVTYAAAMATTYSIIALMRP